MMQNFFRFKICLTKFSIMFPLDCENKCQEEESYCGLELYNFDNKCHLDCENEKIKSAERKFEPVHGNQCNGAGNIE